MLVEGVGEALGGGNSSNGLGAGAVMAMAAPLLLNMLNNKPAQNAAANQTLQTVNPAPAVDTSGATSLLGNLLGGLGGNAAAQQPQQQTQQSGGLLSSLFGGNAAAQQPQQQAQEQSSGGLLSGLLGLLK